MTKINVPVREVPETPEETEYLNKKEWQKPTKPTAGMLYQEHKLVVGIVIGCILMGVLFLYFQNKNYGAINAKFSRFEKLVQEGEYYSNVCQNAVEKSIVVKDEMKVIREELPGMIADKIKVRQLKVVESPEVKPN